MKSPNEKPTVRLIGEDGNAFNIIGIVSRALRKAGADGEYVKKYITEASVGNYDTLLMVTMNYVDVE